MIDPDEARSTADEIAWIDRALLKLPPTRRNIFLLNRLENMTYTEIADAYGVSARTVEREVFLVMLRLRYEQEGMRWPWRRRLLDLFAR